MNILMPQLGETVAEGKITKWFSRRRRCGEAGRQSVRDRDRQGVDGGAGDGNRRAERNPRAGRRSRAGRRGCGRDRRGGGRTGEIGVGGNSSAGSVRLVRLARIGPGENACGRRRRSAPAPQRPIKLDPFFEVRTPERNFGPARLSGGVTVTPLARRLASEAGIDLSRLRGSGPHGRIVARDVESAPRPAAAPAPCAPHPPLAALPKVRAPIRSKRFTSPASYEEVPLDGMRKTIAARLTQATQTIPHFYLTADIEIDRLKELREEANAAAPKDRDGKAVVQALAQRFHHPRAGAGAATRARRQCGVGGRSHSALQTLGYWRRRGARRRLDHAGDPQCGD